MSQASQAKHCQPFRQQLPPSASHRTLPRWCSQIRRNKPRGIPGDDWLAHDRKSRTRQKFLGFRWRGPTRNAGVSCLADNGLQARIPRNLALAILFAFTKIDRVESTLQFWARSGCSDEPAFTRGELDQALKR